MRAAFCLGFLMLTAGCAAAKSGGETVEMSTIASGSYAVSEAKTAVVALSEADYQRMWKELIGSGEAAAPDADFATGTVLFLFAGTRTTGGWSVEPSAVTMETGGTAVIVAKIKGPPAGSMVTQALTSPYAVVFVRDRNVKKVRWAE